MRSSEVTYGITGIAIIVCLWTVILALLCAFVAGNTNVLDWPTFGRFIIVVIWAVGSGLWGILGYYLGEELGKDLNRYD